jgi:hypothetical protein
LSDLLVPLVLLGLPELTVLREYRGQPERAQTLPAAGTTRFSGKMIIL